MNANFSLAEMCIFCNLNFDTIKLLQLTDQLHTIISNNILL